MGHYPITLELRQRLVVVIGGNATALARVRALLESEARVRVFADDVVAELAELALAGRIELRRGAPVLDGATLVLAITQDPALMRHLREETEAQGQLLNVMDETEHCSFLMPSVLRRGPLTVAVSTGGTSPGMARRVRSLLERWLGPAWTDFMELASQARSELKGRGASCGERELFCDRLCESDVLARLEQGDRARAEARVAELVAGVLHEAHAAAS